MSVQTITIKTKVWLHPGHAGWHFITVPKKESAQIREVSQGIKRGWGSVRVEVKLGKTTWNTSIFPDTKFGTYLLPLKASVRATEEIGEDDVVSITLKLL